MSVQIFKTSLTGVFWTLIDVLINKFGFFLFTIFIARIIGPEQYGLIGMITVFITIGNSLVDNGMSLSIITRRRINNNDLSTIFLGSLLISIVVYVFFYFLAPSISDFYNQDILKNLIRIYCLTFVISAFRITQNAVLIRNLQFKKITLINIPSTIISGISGIILASKDYGVWSVIYMYLIQQFILTVQLWYFSGVRFKVFFSKKIFFEHLNFGYKFTVSGLLNTVFYNLNNVLIGKFYPSKDSGYYERAYSLNFYPTSVFVSVISKVFVPILSKIKEDKKRVAFITMELMRFSMLLISLLMIFMIFFSKDIIKIILGSEWIQASLFLQIISFSMIYLPVHIFNMNILQIYGRSDLFLKAEIFKKIFQFVCVVILFNFGIHWMVSSLILLSFFEIFLNSYFVGMVIDLGVKKQLLNILKPSCLILVSILVLFAIKMEFEGIFNTSLFVLIVSVVLFGSYSIYFLFYERKKILNLIKFLKNNT